MADEFQDMIAANKKARSVAEIRSWAEMDTWSVEEGLLLVTGISPDGAGIQWGGWATKDGGRFNRVHIRNAKPLAESITFLTIPAPTVRIGTLVPLPDGGAYSATGELDTDEQKLRKLSILRDLEDRLDRAHRLWVAGPHKDERYPASYFIEWAKSKSIDVPNDLERAVSASMESSAGLDEDPDKRRIEFVKMKKSGMTDAEIAKAEGAKGRKISRARVQKLRTEGEEILADKIKKSSTMIGQLNPKGVAGQKSKTKTG
jgi:hypothetical protein